MCKYCESGLLDPICSLYEDDSYVLQLSPHTPIGDKRYLELYNSNTTEDFQVPINYCPMCGNKLKVGRSNERNK